MQESYPSPGEINQGNVITFSQVLLPGSYLLSRALHKIAGLAPKTPGP